MEQARALSWVMRKLASSHVVVGESKYAFPCPLCNQISAHAVYVCTNNEQSTHFRTQDRNHEIAVFTPHFLRRRPWKLRQTGHNKAEGWKEGSRRERALVRTSSQACLLSGRQTQRNRFTDKHANKRAETRDRKRNWAHANQTRWVQDKKKPEGTWWSASWEYNFHN
jgi:hypothetical protein